MSTRARSNTVLVAIGIVVVLLIGVAVIFSLQPPPTFDPGTPEPTAQGYFQAISDGDEDLAESYMTDDLARACSGQWHFYEMRGNHSVVITSSEIDGDTAKLRVTIRVSYGDGPFGGGSYDQDETLTMERHGDVWLIAKPVWPMDRYACEMEN